MPEGFQTESMLAVLKDIGFGFGVAGLKLIGSLAFPGAWPLIEGALDPVLDRLKEKLKTEDPLDAEHAAEAWSVLQRDEALVASFEAKLHAEITSLRASHNELNEGQRRLIQLLDGNTGILKVIQDDLDRMRVHGVTIADASVEVIRKAVGQEFADRMRSLQLGIAEVIAERDGAAAKRREEIRRRFRDQLARTQVRAVEMLNAREFDRAADELRAGLRSLELLIEDAPEDIDLRVNLGYYYKTIGAAFNSLDAEDLPEPIDKAKLVDEFNDRAMGIFYFVAHGIPLEWKTAQDHAHAVNGVGNIHYARGEYHSALENYDLATRIDPYYCYAWHDMFAARYALAGLDEVDFPAMRYALDKTWQTGQGQPGLGRRRLEQLEGMIATYDPARIVDRLIEEGTRQFKDLAEFVRAQEGRPDRAPLEDDELGAAARAAKRGADEIARRALERIIDDHETGAAPDPRRAAVAKRYLGSIAARSDMATAHKLYAEAVILDPDDADGWHALGSVETHLGHIQDAAHNFLRAAIQARNNGNLAFAGQAIENAADTLLADPDTRMRGANLARGLLYFFAAMGHEQGLLRTYEKLIATGIASGNLREAEQFIKYALALARKGGQRLSEAKLALSAATISTYKADRAAAIEQLQRAKRILEETGPEPLLEEIDQQLARLTDLQGTPSDTP